MNKKQRITQILKKISSIYPTNPKTELTHKTPFQLLVATILSAQCTDTRVNIVTKTLFKKYIIPKDFADADQKQLEHDIHSTGFYRNKAKHIIVSSKIITEKYNSQVPKTMKDLITLPGVARKTANVVLSEAYNINEGIAVDTHVARISQRLGLTDQKDPKNIEKDLMKITPKNKWRTLSNLLIFHGRRTCKSRSPKCAQCTLKNICPSASIYNTHF
ncbi:MAG: endonuclease III [Candidatus Nanohalarchaeota archaeon]|nr:MAG: endonuclease III [Candidatus Nanohaloarchaeota archaeon]